jgi:uncharacterized protein YciI
MLLTFVAHFKPNSQEEHQALKRAFTDHLMQPLNPRIKLAGAITDEAGRQAGVFLMLETASLETAQRFLAESPYRKLYDRVELNVIQLEVGSA